MLVFSDMTVHFFAQKHAFISTPAVQGPLRFSFTYSNMLICMPSYSHSHFTYGFQDVAKDQTTVNIKHLQ